jgi:hypothetical protein
MVLNCKWKITFTYRKWQIHLHIENIIFTLIRRIITIYCTVHVRSASCENEFPYFLVIFFQLSNVFFGPYFVSVALNANIFMLDEARCNLRRSTFKFDFEVVFVRFAFNFIFSAIVGTFFSTRERF